MINGGLTKSRNSTRNKSRREHLASFDENGKKRVSKTGVQSETVLSPTSARGIASSGNMQEGHIRVSSIGRRNVGEVIFRVFVQSGGGSSTPREEHHSADRS
jgi:hypothetical protein